MVLYKGRPEDTDGREAKEIKAYDFLDRLGVEYDRVDHDVAMTMDDCAEIDKVLGSDTCKNLFLCNRQQTDFYLLLMPASKPFKTKDISAQLGTARLSFASEEQMVKYLGVTPGSATVLGLMNDKDREVTLVIDEDVLKGESIGCHPCMNTSSIKISTADMIEKVIPATKHTYRTVKL
ncbi:MAG: prolyl-tRNA synthetase associated domain-containing protein [Clostridia bacterium]|nr:prolyl-tRNA synthetase associated domain-containing protein [Clostridia bacterium]